MKRKGTPYQAKLKKKGDDKDDGGDDEDQHPLHIVKFITKEVESLAEPCGIWIWGPACTGKTTLARETVTKAGYTPYWKNCDNKWFDGYWTGNAIIMDNVATPKKWMYTYIKMLGGCQPIRVEKKGGSMVIRPPMFIVVSNRCPFAEIDAQELTEENKWEKEWKKEIESRFIFVETKNGLKPEITPRKVQMEPEFDWDREQVVESIVGEQEFKKQKKGGKK